MLNLAKNDVPVQMAAATFHFGMTAAVIFQAAPLQKKIVLLQIFAAREYLEDPKNVNGYRQVNFSMRCNHPIPSYALLHLNLFAVLICLKINF